MPKFLTSDIPFNSMLLAYIFQSIFSTLKKNYKSVLKNTTESEKYLSELNNFAKSKNVTVLSNI